MPKLFCAALILCMSCVPHNSSRAVSTSKKTHSSLLKLGIYYGYPEVLGKNSEQIARVVNQYDLFVFGDGLQVESHPQHQLLKQAMKNIHSKVFGYISIGKNKSWSQQTIFKHIDDWKNKIGVQGIFIDEMDLSLAPEGVDFVERIKMTIQKVRDNGLFVFGNGPSPMDLFSSASGLEESWKKGDFYLFENYAQNIGDEKSFNEYRFRVQRLKSFSRDLGFRTICFQDTDLWDNSLPNQARFDKLFKSAIDDGCEGLGASSLTAFDKPMPNFIWPR